MSKTIYVYETFSSQKSEIMGYLYIDFSRGSEHHSFEFDNNWLKSHSCKFTLDPELYFTQGRQYPAGKPTFGIFSDASPDRWGRVLMERKERFTADKESRKPKKLNSGDYLLGVYDESRMGALRFKSETSGDFLSYDKETSVPPWTALRTLEEASRNFENEETTLQEKWLNQLIRPGSSLGGARPKATVKDPDGELWIAKFPSRKDDYNIGAWEKTANDLAVLCGLNVPQTRLENFSKLGSTLTNWLLGLTDFMKVLSPAYFMTVAASTGSSTAAAFYEGILLMIWAVQWLLANLFLPAVNLSLLLKMVNYLSKEEMLTKMAELLDVAVNWGLKTLLGAIVGLQIVRNMVSPVMDAMKRSAVGKAASAIPGIGNAVTAVTELVLTSAVMVRNSFGAVIVILLLLIGAGPIIHYGSLSLVYRFLAAIAQPISDKRVVGALSTMGEGCAMLLKLLLTAEVLCMLTFLIVVVSVS